jgi:hypothetical protein
LGIRVRDRRRKKGGRERKEIKRERKKGKGKRKLRRKGKRKIGKGKRKKRFRNLGEILGNLGGKGKGFCGFFRVSWIPA